MYNFLIKKGQMVAFLLGAIFAIAHIVLAATTTEAFTYIDQNGVEVNKEIAGVSAGLAISYILIGIAVLVFLFGVAKYFIENPNQIKSLLGFVALFVIVVVFIMMASGDAPEALRETVEKEGISPGVYKYVNGSVNATVVLLGLAFAGLIISEVTSMFK